MVMRQLRRPRLFAVSVVLSAAVAGALAGYACSFLLTMRLAQQKLAQDAIQIESVVGAYTSETQFVLAALNAARFPFCSHDEMIYARGLVFRAKYLRDAGHMRSGIIECSAVLGSKGMREKQFKPDLVETDGTAIYRDLPPYNSEDTAYLYRSGNSYVVRDPSFNRFMHGINQSFTLTVLDTATGSWGRLSGKPPALPGAVTTRDAAGRVSDTLYVTRCMSKTPGCITAFSHLSEAMHTNRVPTIAFTVMASLTAAVLGLLLVFSLHRRSGMEHQLRRAVAKDRLRVVYQPIVDLPGRRIVGAEALARWTDEEGFAVAPDVFVPLAERCGFVTALTRRVFQHALRDFAATLNTHPGFCLNLNVAAADLFDPGFISRLEESVRQAAVAPRSLAIEITESSTARGTAASETIARLRDSGYSVHIDDFGTGYSSLAYLQDLAVDAIKIDQSFTRAVGTGSASAAILVRILGMAEALDLSVTVEGIETEEQAAYFAECGQPMQAQGWLFGRPLEAAEFLRRLAEQDRGSLNPQA